MDNQFRLDQLIERGGKRELRIKGAEARVDAAKLARIDTARQQSPRCQAYYNFRLAQEKQALPRETAALYGKNTEAGRFRQRVGDIAPVDLPPADRPGTRRQRRPPGAGRARTSPGQPCLPDRTRSGCRPSAGQRQLADAGRSGAARSAARRAARHRGGAASPGGRRGRSRPAESAQAARRNAGHAVRAQPAECAQTVRLRG